jgi:hypothetical protein
MIEFKNEYGAVLFNERESKEYKKDWRAALAVFLFIYFIVTLPVTLLIVFPLFYNITVTNVFCSLLFVIVSIFYFRFLYVVFYRDTGLIIFENGVGLPGKQFKFLPFDDIKTVLIGIQKEKEEKTKRDLLLIFLLKTKEQIESIEIQFKNDFNKAIKILNNKVELNERPLICKDNEMISNVLQIDNWKHEKQKLCWGRSARDLILFGAFFLIISCILIIFLITNFIIDFVNLSSKIIVIMSGIILIFVFFSLIPLHIGINQIGYESYLHPIDTQNPKNKKALFIELTRDLLIVQKNHDNGKKDRGEGKLDYIIKDPITNEEINLRYDYSPKKKKPYIDFEIGKIKPENQKLVNLLKKRIEQSAFDEVCNIHKRMQIE